MFIDRVKIKVTAGSGGNGCVSFRREKHVPFGGPDGGTGGHGGNVILKVDSQKYSLIDFKYTTIFRAGHGDGGQGNNRSGKVGSDCVIKVPPGTLVRDPETLEVIADLVEAGSEFVIASGGQGGRGNSSYATSTHRAPVMYEKGEPGIERYILLDLKLIADVGIVGFPNAGKSTFLSVTSSAKPKIASYPFTTLAPNLGVISKSKEEKFIAADVPGLIEGASDGKGLGHQFLRHVERTALILHLVDFSVPNTHERYKILNREMKKYNSDILKKVQVVVATKKDVEGFDEILKAEARAFKKDKVRIFPVSSVTGEGVQELIDEVFTLIRTIDRTSTVKVKVRKEPVNEGLKIERKNNRFIVQSEEIKKLESMTDFDNIEAMAKFMKRIKKMGVEKRLLRLGIHDGDIVQFFKKEFVYHGEN